MKYVAVIDEPDNRSLPIVARLRRMTCVDRLLWWIFRKKSKYDIVPMPIEYHGMSIRMESDVARVLYGLSNPADCVCDVVEPHRIPEPMRPEELP